MAEYIDSASNNKSDFIRDWLDKNLLVDVKSFYVQSGYFSYPAIKPFAQVLDTMAKSGDGIEFVLGSNAGSLMAADAKAVLDIIKGNPNCSFTVVAFMNAEFHPKCYYIKRKDDSECALVGSGNLTQYGISLNKEAAIVLDSNLGDPLVLIQKIKGSIHKWVTLGENEGAYQIKTVQDVEELRQSKIIDIQNVEARIPRGRLLHQKKAKKVLKKQLKGHWQFTKTLGKSPLFPLIKPTVPIPAVAVLIAEIPKGSGRWKQANFAKDNFENFFGLTIGDKSKKISLQHISANGNLQPIEIHQGVSVKSHNYRIELAAGTGLAYPNTSAPIAVFVRLNPNTFRYRLIMPTDVEFTAVSTFLTNNTLNIQGRMRRLVTDTNQLRAAWPNSPIWVQAGGLF